MEIGYRDYLQARQPITFEISTHDWEYHRDPHAPPARQDKLHSQLLMCPAKPCMLTGSELKETTRLVEGAWCECQV